MLYEEIKRRIFSKYVIISIIAILFLTIVLNVMFVVPKDGNFKILNEEEIYSGEMTEEKLWLGMEKVRDENSTEIRYTSLVDFISGLVEVYPGVLYTEKKVEDYKDEYAKNFYQCWENKFKAILEKIPNENRESALKELNNVEYPFYKYQGSYLWNVGIDNLSIIYLLIIFLVTFFAASAYSDSVEDGSMEIIIATKLGKQTMVFRIVPSLIYGAILTITATLGTVLYFGLITGFEALKSSLKVYSLFSLGNYTLIAGILLMFIGQLLGIMAMTTVMGWVSYRLSRTNLTIAIGTGINIFYIILAFFVKTPGKFINIILNGIPLSTSQIINEMSRFNFDFGLWRPYSILISTAIVFILFGGLLIYKINSSNTF